MADSFGANLMVGLLSVREAGHVTRFVMGLECFSPVRATGSCRVLDVQKSIEHKKIERPSRLDSDACTIRIVRSCGSRKTVSVWSDTPAVSKIWERRNLLLGAWDWQRKSAGVISDRDADIAR